MTINSGKNRRPAPVRPGSSKQTQAAARPDALSTGEAQATFDDSGSAVNGIVVRKRRRDPNWDGWSFTSDIEFSSPVDVDELIDRSTDKRD
ncbi:MAG: hypothetical protein ACRD1H_16925 [Vicinamibacterales bacterium]